MRLSVFEIGCATSSDLFFSYQLFKRSTCEDDKPNILLLRDITSLPYINSLEN